ncbi:MAG: hypothetical protein HY892_09580 [Deltaproteobacteria bacterium]|nr:hypothetical protein [Deltaproteobacteria bacterium]
MIPLDLWLTFSEGAAIMLSAGSLWLLIHGRKSGSWPGPVAETGASGPGSNEALQQLVEESQALCTELLNRVDENKALVNDLPGRMDEKIHQLSRLLNRVEEDSASGPTAGKKNRYLEAMDLAEDGLPLPEIGKRLHLTKGEVQLLLDLKTYCLK